MTERERLGLLVGRWRTEGWTRPAGGASPARIEATDTYEWLPGRYALLHSVDARVGGERVEGAEIIGHDPERGVYATLYFGSDGSSAYAAWFTDRSGILTWRMRSERDAFTGVFSDDADTIEGHWELREPDDSWRPWMDITLTRLA